MPAIKKRRTTHVKAIPMVESQPTTPTTKASVGIQDKEEQVPKEESGEVNNSVTTSTLTLGKRRRRTGDPVYDLSSLNTPRTLRSGRESLDAVVPAKKSKGNTTVKASKNDESKVTIVTTVVPPLQVNSQKSVGLLLTDITSVASSQAHTRLSVEKPLALLEKETELRTILKPEIENHSTQIGLSDSNVKEVTKLPEGKDGILEGGVSLEKVEREVVSNREMVDSVNGSKEADTKDKESSPKKTKTKMINSDPGGENKKPNKEKINSKEGTTPGHKTASTKKFTRSKEELLIAERVDVHTTSAGFESTYNGPELITSYSKKHKRKKQEEGSTKNLVSDSQSLPLVVASTLVSPSLVMDDPEINPEDCFDISYSSLRELDKIYSPPTVKRSSSNGRDSTRSRPESKAKSTPSKSTNILRNISSSTKAEISNDDAKTESNHQIYRSEEVIISDQPLDSSLQLAKSKKSPSKESLPLKGSIRSTSPEQTLRNDHQRSCSLEESNNSSLYYGLQPRPGPDVFIPDDMATFVDIQSPVSIDLMAIVDQLTRNVTPRSTDPQSQSHKDERYRTDDEKTVSLATNLERTPSKKLSSENAASSSSSPSFSSSSSSNRSGNSRYRLPPDVRVESDELSPGHWDRTLFARTERRRRARRVERARNRRARGRANIRVRDRQKSISKLVPQSRYHFPTHSPQVESSRLSRARFWEAQRRAQRREFRARLMARFNNDATTNQSLLPPPLPAPPPPPPIVQLHHARSPDQEFPGDFSSEYSIEARTFLELLIQPDYYQSSDSGAESSLRGGTP